MREGGTGGRRTEAEQRSASEIRNLERDACWSEGRSGTGQGRRLSHRRAKDDGSRRKLVVCCRNDDARYQVAGE